MQKTPLFFIFLGIIVLVLLRPLVCPVTFPKLEIFLQSLTLFLFSVALLSNYKILYTSAYKFPLCLLIIGYGLSTFYSINWQASLQGLPTLLSYIATFYLISQLKPHQTKKVIWAMIAISLVVSLRGIYQRLYGFDFTIEYLNRIRDVHSEHYDFLMKTLLSKRVFSTFLSPPMLAGYLALIIPLAAGLLIDNLQKRRLAIFLAFSILLLSSTLILTKSLGGLVSLLSGAAVFSILIAKNIPLLTANKPQLNMRKIITVAMTIFFILTIIIVIIVAGRAEQFLDFSYPENSIVQRLSYWKSTVQMIKDYPIKGVGWGNFGLIYPRYRTMVWATDIKNAHNNYLQLWAECGIFGITAFLWIALIFLAGNIEGLKRIKIHTPKPSPVRCVAGFAPISGSSNIALAIGLLSAGVAFLTHSLFDYDLFISQVAFHWWAILGLNLSIFKTNHSKD